MNRTISGTRWRLVASFAPIAALAVGGAAPGLAQSPSPTGDKTTPAPAASTSRGQAAGPPGQRRAGNQQSRAPANQDGTRVGRYRLPLPIGINVGGYWPINGQMTSRFGSSPWLGIGVGVGAPTQPQLHITPIFEYAVFYQRKSPDHAFFVPFGAGFRIRLSRRGRFAPYAGAAVYEMLTDFHTVEDNVASRYRFGYGGSLAVGTTYRRRAFTELRYYRLTPIRGLNPSGFELQGGIRF